MRITIRGVSVIFETLFTDEDGEPANPDSATLTVTYPDGCWPFDGSDLVNETIDLTQDETDLSLWTGTWVSQVSNPGLIEWHARATTDDVTSAQEDGHFRLRGNAANLSFLNA